MNLRPVSYKVFFHLVTNSSRLPLAFYALLFPFARKIVRKKFKANLIHREFAKSMNSIKKCVITSVLRCEQSPVSEKQNKSAVTWENFWHVGWTKNQISLRISHYYPVDETAFLTTLYIKWTRWRFLSDCANAQADQYIRLAHISGYITKICLLKYFENVTTKKWKFSDKNFDIFNISAQNIDCAYSIERPRRDCEYSLDPPWRGGSNEYPHSMLLSRNMGVVGWCESVLYLLSPGRPTDFGLQLSKACYPCSR